MVVVEHGKGDMSVYGYNQSALVNVGAQVRAGQPIALVGTSGGRGTPSLYFEIRRQDRRLTHCRGWEDRFALCQNPNSSVNRLSAAGCAAGENSPSSSMTGYRPHEENAVLQMPTAISVAVLPNAPHARLMATRAHSRGREVLIHMPMAPLSKQPLERDTLQPP